MSLFNKSRRRRLERAASAPIPTGMTAGPSQQLRQFLQGHDRPTTAAGAHPRGGMLWWTVVFAFTCALTWWGADPISGAPAHSDDGPPAAPMGLVVNPR